MTAALAHAVVTPTHFREWPAAGVFFAVLALGQGGLATAFVLGRHGTRTLLLAVWGNVAVIATYVVSRTSGLPFGLEPDRAVHRHVGAAIFPHTVEPVGALDLLTLFAEVALIPLLLALLPDRLCRRTTTMLMLAGVALIGGAASGLL